MGKNLLRFPHYPRSVDVNCLADSSPVDAHLCFGAILLSAT